MLEIFGITVDKEFKKKIMKKFMTFSGFSETFWNCTRTCQIFNFPLNTLSLTIFKYFIKTQTRICSNNVFQPNISRFSAAHNTRENKSQKIWNPRIFYTLYGMNINDFHAFSFATCFSFICFRLMHVFVYHKAGSFADGWKNGIECGGL